MANALSCLEIARRPQWQGNHAARRAVTARTVLTVAMIVLPIGELAASAENRSGVALTTVWQSGTDGYHSYRIPSILTTKSGALLAFCEGRKDSRSDSGNIDVLLKRSTDGGKTWSPQQVVWSDGENTCGNPCPVVDEQTGAIWLLMTHNLGEDNEKSLNGRSSRGTRTVWVTSSRDDGKTWDEPKDITADTKKPEWTWYATGPGIGIQLQRGAHRGRLVIPCDYKVGAEGGFSHVIYSDDGGQQWKLGESVPPGDTNECQVAELPDGRLLLNMRNHDRKKRHRAVAISSDGGETWQKWRHDPSLPEPICQASLIRFVPSEASTKEWLLFSNPADQKDRKRLTVRLSKDGGESWPEKVVVYQGSAAYSCLVALPNARIGCLFERDEYREIVLATFQLSAMSKEP